MFTIAYNPQLSLPWVIHRKDNGVPLIALGWEGRAEGRVKVLIRNEGKFINTSDQVVYMKMESPVEWFKFVRSQKWTFTKSTSFRVVPGFTDGRVFLSGNFREYVAPFEYLVFDLDVIDQLRAAAPEIQYFDADGSTV